MLCIMAILLMQRDAKRGSTVIKQLISYRFRGANSQMPIANSKVFD